MGCVEWGREGPGRLISNCLHPDSRTVIAQSRRRWLPATICAACFCAFASVSAAPQQPAPAVTAQVRLPGVAPVTWTETAVAHEVEIISEDGTAPLQYREHKVDEKGDVTREVIESRQGTVARLIERNGRPLTAEDDAAERDRLQAILSSPSDFLKHHKRDNSTRDDTLQLVKLMPKAMLYTYTLNQPQRPHANGTEVVLDFHPNPAFKPPSMEADLLTGLEGRIWVDPKTGHMTRVEGRVIHPVSFGWGFVGKIYPGGTIDLEPVDASQDRWIYAQLNTHLNLRVIIKSIAMNETMTRTDFRPLAAPVDFQQAVRLLLAMPFPTR